MPIARLLIRESRVDKAQKRSGAMRSQINCHHVSAPSVAAVSQVISSSAFGCSFRNRP